jgi:uncharacterized membrane protein
MIQQTISTLMSPLDWAAFALFLLTVFGYARISARPIFRARSIVGAIQRQRIAWMINMAGRDNRVLDAVVITSLGQGNAFFASTAAIVIGGLAAIMGSGEKLQALLAQLPFVAHSSPVLLEMKILVIMGVFVYAFFKFAWAFRLSHYTSIMIAATPVCQPAPAATETAAERVGRQGHAERTAELVGLAAEHANSGLRSFYWAIAAMAWFFHPVAFVAATLWVLLILIRRDFFSRSLRLIGN